MSTQHALPLKTTTDCPDTVQSDIDDDDPDEEASLSISSQSENSSTNVNRQAVRQAAARPVAKLIRYLRNLVLNFSAGTGTRHLQSSYSQVSPGDRLTAGDRSGLIHSVFSTLRLIACYSYTNMLLVFVPVGVATYLTNCKTPVVFTTNAVAIIPLSGLLTYATENIARDAGDTIGALVNITFGNLVEIIMFVALHNNQIRVVQASLSGSILVNLLLILGTAILAGAAFQDHEQLHNRNEAQALACLLCVAVFSMVIPNAFYHSISDKEAGKAAVLILSRACALILIFVYILYLIFQLRRGQAQAVQADNSPAPTLAVLQHSADSRSPHLLPRSIRFEDAEHGPLTDDVMSTSDKSFELNQFDSAGEDEDDNAAVDEPQDVKTHNKKLNHSRKQRDNSEHRERTTIYQRHSRGRSSNSLHSHRDRSLSAARSASSYSRIFLGSPSTEDIPATIELQDHVTPISKTTSAILLITSSLLVAICAEFLINTVDDMVKEAALSEAFIGLIILPIVGNCAEHITAVTVAVKNKLDLAIAVSVGSAIQVGLILTPLIVLVGWALNKEMTMYFSLFETVALVATAFLVNFLILNGRTNFLEGSLLCACYVIIGVGAYLFPDTGSESSA